jgi:hypothetical protein
VAENKKVLRRQTIFEIRFQAAESRTATSSSPLESAWLELQILCLLIQARAVKPISIMKTLSGTFAFVVLAVIATVTLLSCSKQVFKAEHKQKVYLEFGKEGTKTTEYVELEGDHKDFFDALCALKNKDGCIKVGYLARDGGTEIDACADPCSLKSINTDKITTAGVARTGPAEESSAYDPHAVYRVQSNSAKDIKDVLKTFKD